MNKNKLIIILFELGWVISVNIIGSITISELFLILFVPLYFKRSLFRENKDLLKLTKIYAFLLSFQIISEIFVSNGLNNSLKGCAVTIVSFLHIVFLYRYLYKDKKLIPILLFAQVLMMIVRGPGRNAELDVGGAIGGENVYILKFYLVPLLNVLLVAISVISYRKYLPILFVIIGSSIIVLGARSGGAQILISGIVVYFIQNRIFSGKNLKIGFIIATIVGYWLYTIYVDNVLSGEISAGNSTQLLECENPYNPFELLIRGRSEAFVGWQAFLDKPLFGHGAWAIDKTHRYARMMAEMHAEDFVYRPDKQYLVPGHSLIIGFGVWEGVFAMIGIIAIFIFFMKKSFRILRKVDPKYQLLLVSFMFQIIWTFTFSPNSHLRQTLPIPFAVILVLYFDIKNKEKKQIQNDDKVSDIK